ncbi:MAG: antitoxin Xre/MbcA/ParS toxin-binding domain-containing protein [Pseudomonadota bacterium]
MIDARQIAAVMGGKAVLGQVIRSITDLEARVVRGLPRKAIETCVRRIIDRPAERRAVIYRFVPKATFHRTRRLSFAHSECTERLARVIATAEWVWGDRADAREWLMTPHPGLGGKKPIEAAVTEIGARQAELILWKGAYGLPV